MPQNPDPLIDSAVFRRAIRVALPAYLVFEAASFAGHFFPSVSSIAFLLIVAVAVWLAWNRPQDALLVLLSELFVGSQGGYMVALQYGGTFVSLRIGLFLAVFGVWFAKSLLGWLRGRMTHPDLAWFALLREKRLLWPYVFLLAALAYGALRGLALNDTAEVFFDANGYAYFALLPAFLAAFSRAEAAGGAATLRTRVMATLFAAVADSVLKALVVLFFFSHRQFGIAWQMYLWVRDTRVGEITIMTADFYRIFFQSQIWSLGLIVGGALYAAYLPSWRTARARAVLGIITCGMIAMVLSLSRSFWFGGAVAAAALTVLLLWVRAEYAVWRRLVYIGAGSVLCAVAVIVALYAFPYPRKTGDMSFAMLLSSRATSFGDAAASSRWALLPILMDAGLEHPVLGSGLGRSVTYTTSDPRLLADNPTGKYTTSAFEWGYHDLWVKFGAFGILAYAWFLVRLFAPLLRVTAAARPALAKIGTDFAGKETAVFSAGLALALVALLATNVFSPYLNHPLGIGLMMLVAVL